MRKKKALITGVTGQDGSYLAEFLLNKGYQVHGIKRRSSIINTSRIDHIYTDPNAENIDFKMHYGDLSDANSIISILKRIRPTEIYNLAAQSHVAVSFENPIYTSDIDALGTLRILEAIRILNLEKETKFYQASSSELYGLVQSTPQNEKTPFYPRSPYGVSKLFAYWITINYRESYGMYACNGILFNHESPRRGETFVTRKITQGMARAAVGLQNEIFLGNLNAMRDWGHAKDYVEMQWLMLQQDHPEDYVISSGEQHSIRDFILWCCEFLDIELIFEGHGLAEIGVVRKNNGKKAPALKEGSSLIKVDKRYYRPSEVESLLGDSNKAKSKLGWKPSISAKDLCKEMIEEDLIKAKKELLITESEL